jgi:CheY-like chemotaxis protein/anti-sigma regulatory factor (Ser/Thr protein kinase)
VHLDLDLAPGLRPVRCDPNALTNAIMNLCVNAVDAIGGQGRLSLRTRNAENGSVEIQVRDAGCGMTKEVLERALDPFFTTKPEGKGTGLGLTLVYGVVKAHKGQMEIQSEVGQGTTVTLQFPASSPEAPAAQTGSSPSGMPSHRALEVLVVDDDECYRLSIQMMLETLGHHATFARSGEDSLALIDGGFRPDAVLLDLNMPGLSGAETLPLLRKRLPRVPVVIATGRADQAALDLAGSQPIVALMPKPFTMADFQKQLTALGGGGQAPDVA